MSLLSLDHSQNNSRLTVFLNEGKRVFHVSILSLVRSGKGFTSGRISYGQASTYRPCPMYYVTVLMFVCLYVCTTLAVLLLLFSWTLVCGVCPDYEVMMFQPWTGTQYVPMLHH